MSTRTKRNPFAESAETGEIFLEAGPKIVGIHPLIIYGGEFKITRFGNLDVDYLKVQDVIDWHEKEYRETGIKGCHLEAATHFRGILAEVEAERAAKKGDAS